MIHILQCKVSSERKAFQRMIFVGHSDKTAIKKANQLVLDDNPKNFVSLTIFKDGVAVMQVRGVDRILATYVLSRGEPRKERKGK